MVVQNYSLGLIKGQIPPHSHNVLLQIWLETGIVGAVSFLGFMLGTLKKGIKAILNSPDKRCKNIIIAGIASITGILAVSFAEYVWYYPRVMMIFWIVVGLTLAAIKLSLNEKNIYQ
jgi:putative inorganic carbon (HCO3(-)) transporter